jgi:uncharacterized protein (TIGR03067 family)
MRPLRLTFARPTAPVAHRLVSLHVASAVWLAFTVAGSAQVPTAAPVPDDRAISVGRWDVVSVEWDGKPVDPEFLAMLQVAYEADGSWAVLFKNRPVAQGTSTNNQDRSPKTFEMATLGSNGIAPVRYAGIYRLDGNVRVLCIVHDGEPRPEDFKAPKRSGRMLVTLRRSSASRGS